MNETIEMKREKLEKKIKQEVYKKLIDYLGLNGDTANEIIHHKLFNKFEKVSIIITPVRFSKRKPFTFKEFDLMLCKMRTALENSSRPTD